MAAILRRLTVRQMEFRDWLPRQPPPSWPSGAEWRDRWEMLAAHVFDRATVAELARRYRVSRRTAWYRLHEAETRARALRGWSG